MTERQTQYQILTAQIENLTKQLEVVKDKISSLYKEKQELEEKLQRTKLDESRLKAEMAFEIKAVHDEKNAPRLTGIDRDKVYTLVFLGLNNDNRIVTCHENEVLNPRRKELVFYKNGRGCNWKTKGWYLENPKSVL